MQKQEIIKIRQVNSRDKTMETESLPKLGSRWYNKRDLSLRHLPVALILKSETPSLEASEAPPILKEWNEKLPSLISALLIASEKSLDAELYNNFLDL